MDREKLRRPTEVSGGAALQRRPAEALAGDQPVGQQEGGFFYPNSAQRIGRDAVQAQFSEANLRGAVPEALIERELGPGMIVGRVAIRQKLEQLLGGKDQKRRANMWLVEAEPLLRRWRGLVDYVPEAELRDFAKRRTDEIRGQQVIRAKTAREKKV